MDTETLQQLITMVGSAGEGAFTLVCIYFASIVFTKLLMAGVFVALIVAAYKVAKGFMNQSELMSVLNAQLGTHYVLPLYRTEVREITSKLKRLKDDM